MLKLEVGKYYKNREDKKIGPIELNHSQAYPYGSNGESWTVSGLTWTSGGISNSDLIEEWKDEEMKSPHISGIDIVFPDTASILAERQKPHGDFTDNARVMQKLKEAVMCEDGWQKLSLVQREALQMILHKCGRIISGNPNEPDHWLDIAGYATLAKDRVER